MKWMPIVILFSILSGCAMIGTNIIHSPNAENGYAFKQKHVHVGATKKAPPDAIAFSITDSTSIVVGARTIQQKKNFGGIILPIFPIFWLPKVNYYENRPDRLIIKMSTLETNQEFDIVTATIKVNGENFELKNVSASANSKELEFYVDAVTTDQFELTDLEIKMQDNTIALPTISFKKMKQRWRFIGP